ncbi:hypothetical protein [Wolbachia endosymbiont (group A) of Urophora cardui]|uniref:hypothetical protein n=1 Tax=Wolbachia endosymbiont (group A) of Urophora cardui TaxID=3066156 RepID=UPI00333E3939
MQQSQSELEQLDWQAKRSLIRTLVKEVNIDLDEVNVVFKIRELNNPAQNGQNQKLADCLRCLGTGMTPFAVQFTFKNECSYSYVSATCMTPCWWDNVCIVVRHALE